MGRYVDLAREIEADLSWGEQAHELNEFYEKKVGSSEAEHIQPETRGPVPDTWREGVARLTVLPCPDDVLPARWRTLQADATRFLGTWGVQAAGLGWSAHDVFGVNRIKPFVRLDAAGLVRLLNGRPIVALTETEAVIGCTTGSRQAYRRKLSGVVPAGEQDLLWEVGG